VQAIWRRLSLAAVARESPSVVVHRDDAVRVHGRTTRARPSVERPLFRIVGVARSLLVPEQVGRGLDPLRLRATVTDRDALREGEAGAEGGIQIHTPTVGQWRSMTRTFRRPPLSQPGPVSSMMTSVSADRSGVSKRRTLTIPDPTMKTSTMAAITGTRMIARTESNTRSPAPTAARRTHDGWRLTARKKRHARPERLLNEG
jgi:hypothetical protein